MAINSYTPPPYSYVQYYVYLNTLCWKLGGKRNAAPYAYYNENTPGKINSTTNPIYLASTWAINAKRRFSTAYHMYVFEYTYYVHCSCGGVGENVRKINQTEPGEFNLQLISIYSVLLVYTGVYANGGF